MALLECRDLLGGHHFTDLDVEIRPVLAHPPNEIGNAAVERRADASDDEALTLRFSDPLRLIAHMLQSPEDLRCLLQEEASRLREGQRPLRAINQDDTQFLLKLLYLSAEGWLGNVQEFCRARKIALCCDRYEIPKLANFHVLALSGPEY